MGNIGSNNIDAGKFKKKKRLYTVWHSDRKSIRSRVLLRQKTNNVKNKDEDKIETGSETKDKNVKK